MLALLIACTCARPVEEIPPEAATPGEPPLILKPLEDFVPDNPALLYAECGERIEGHGETPGECESDGDCVAAGCSREVCVPLSMANETYTTCETRLCFMAVDRCGCTEEGLCRWTLKEPGPG